jgi:hypothetical protein
VFMPVLAKNGQRRGKRGFASHAKGLNARFRD